MYNEMKIPNVILSLSIGLLSMARAQTFEEFKRQQDSARQQLQREQQDFAQQYVKDFNRFVEERDQEFAKMLQERFRQVNLSRARQQEPLPKPVVIPTYVPSKDESPANQRILVDTASGTLERSRSLLLPLPTSDNKTPYAAQQVSFMFYDTPLTVPYDPQLILSAQTQYNALTLSEAWLTLSNTHLQELIHTLYRYKGQFNLNDWGYYQLVRQFAEQLYTPEDPRARLTVWFLLNKSRYKAKIGYADNQLYVLLPTNCTVYAAAYYTFGQQTYYATDTVASSLFTYAHDYAGADQILDLDIRQPLTLGGTPKERILSFRYAEQTYPVRVAYSPRAIRFYQTYPEVDLRVKLESALSREAKESLTAQLAPLVQDRDPAEAVALLLRFVQTAFDYQLDQAQFGREKYFFPEEMLHFTASDCEDRTALFAYLVRQLLGLKVVAVQYPGHVATAVRLPQQAGGEFIEQDGERFIVCDPTYINAPVGKTMPRYARGPVQLLALRDPNQQQLTEMIWETASANGVYPGASHHNVVVDADDNIYFAGYTLADQAAEGQDIYLAKFAPTGKRLWEKKLSGPGNDVGQYLALDEHQQVYLAGRYEHELRLAPETTLTTPASGFFVAKFTPEGQLTWARDIPTPTSGLEQAFAAKISEQGQLVETLVFDETVADQVALDRGIALDGQGFVYFSGDHNVPTSVPSTGSNR